MSEIELSGKGKSYLSKNQIRVFQTFSDASKNELNAFFKKLPYRNIIAREPFDKTVSHHATHYGRRAEKEKADKEFERLNKKEISEGAIKADQDEWAQKNKTTAKDGEGNTIGGVIYVSPARKKLKTKNGGFPVESVTINTFIPHNWVGHPTGRIFSGDNRFTGKWTTSTTYIRKWNSVYSEKVYVSEWKNRKATWKEFGSHRTQQRFFVVADKASGSLNGLVKDAFPPDSDGRGNTDRLVNIGDTNEFHKSSSLDSRQLISAEAWADKTPGKPLWVDTKKASPRELSSTSKFIGTKIVELSCKCKAVNPLVSIGPSPAIDYDFTIIIDRDKNQYKISGSHDGFPAYEIYINGMRVYESDPLAKGKAPNALFGKDDQKCNVEPKGLP